MPGWASEPLDLFALPLRGLSSIEASAGTGKTFTITKLYLRLVLEAALPVRDVLVVTYTKAATAELRDKLRAALVHARRAFETGASDDEFTAALVAKTTDRAGARRLLERALYAFDEAAVFTIHGFCQRVLAEHAFESGALFETTLVPDQRALLQEVVDDFWRRELYEASHGFVRFALERGKLTPEMLVGLLRDHGGRPYARIEAPPDPTDLVDREAKFAAAVAALRGAWPHARGVVETTLCTSPSLSRQRYRIVNIPGWLRDVDALLDDAHPDACLFEHFERFTSAGLARGTKAGAAPPSHPCVAECDAVAAAAAPLRDGYTARVGALQARLLAQAADELARRKTARRVQSYDDLVAGLAHALADAARGPALAAALRARYRAALVDEFQDTDVLQYDILRRIYGDGPAPVVLVGDPKQAIYGFRGADVFAYLRARSDARVRRHLEANWRSAPALVGAVNACFTGARNPFVLETIEFVPTEPAPTTGATLDVREDAPQPFRLWTLDGEDVVGRDEARTRAAYASAREIARLVALGVAGRAHLDGKPLHGGHIAVLVRRNVDGRLMRESLLAEGVKSVQQAVDSVFASPEALELERVLLAVASPAQPTLVRAALSTELLGLGAAEILALEQDEAGWEARVEAFHEYHALWRRRGFAPMCRDLWRRERVADRLLAYDDGERRLTNLLHLTELAQAAERETGSGMDALVEWLADARTAAADTEEEQQLRLESDEQLVRIVTVHKAKGLEYPIVFCPFAWDGAAFAERGPVVVHEDAAEAAATLDLGSSALAARRPLAHREQLAEQVRLLYVALTRATQRCVVVWGRVNGGGRSALAWLLHRPPGADGRGDPVAALTAHFKGLSQSAFRGDLARLAARAPDGIRIEPLPEPAAPPVPEPETPAVAGAARRLGRTLRMPWEIASFTRLAAGRDPERPDHDAVVAPTPAATGRTRRDLFGFPAGARAGNCLHAIFEHVDFTDEHGWADIVHRHARRFGYEAVWEPVLLGCVARTVATPLDATGTLRLDRVGRGDRVSELEFHHPLARLDPARLVACLRAHGFGQGPVRDAIGRLRFVPVAGFMKGYLDGVVRVAGRYWLLDYKSTWLGATLEDYAVDRLAGVIATEAYWLQYLLYTVVLHRWLRLRLADYDYDRHVGGVRYLFLRGLDPARGVATGVWSDRPSRPLIEALDGMMAGAGA